MELSDSESTEDIFCPVSKSGLGGLFQSNPTENNTNLKYAAPKKNSEEVTTESNTGLPNTKWSVQKYFPKKKLFISIFYQAKQYQSGDGFASVDL